MEKKLSKSEALYKDAIVMAARAGHLGHAALSSERYANFLLKEVGDEDGAGHQMKETIRFYCDWGADAKVRILRDSFAIDG